MDYPLSIIGYFVFGIMGATTFLFLLLLFDKRIAILENKLLRPRYMTMIYVVMGGVLSVVVNLAGNPDFGANQLTIAFSAGLGWPAIAAGFTAGKRVGEINEEKEKRGDRAKAMKAHSDNTAECLENYYKKRLKESKRYYQMMTERADAELEELYKYYSQKFSSMGGV